MKFLLEGVCEALPPGLGISRISKILKSMISSLEKVLSTLGPSQYIYIIEILEFILVLENRAEELGDLSEIALYADNILHLCLRAEAFSNSDISVKSSKVIQSVFSIAQENSQLFFEILVEIAEDTVEKWHNYDENVILM